VGRLTVDQIAAPVGGGVRLPGSVTPSFLAHDEQQTDARLTLVAQPVRRGDLGGENSLRVAGAASVQSIAIDAAGKKRRHAVEMRGHYDQRRAGGRDDVEARVVDRLVGDRESSAAKILRQPARGGAFTA